MASVGHVAVGMAAARLYHASGRAPSWRSMAAWSALSLLPDVDVIGFSLGVQYGDPWGHRGATHSLAIAAAIGLATGLGARRFRGFSRRTAICACAVLASHGLLDTLTDGGLGAALLWPFSLTRYFAPWRPIPVAPIGLAFFSPYGLFVSLVELVLFAPLLVYAVRPGLLRRPLVAGAVLVPWLVSVWLIASSDPIREAVVGTVLREDTAYTSGYSERAFNAIVPGQSQQNVRDRLGPPREESWFYPMPGERAADASAAAVEGCRGVRLERGSVVAAFAPEACRKAGIVAGTAGGEAARALGPAPESCWQYSWSPTVAHYRARDVCFVGSTVDAIIRGWR